MNHSKWLRDEVTPTMKTILRPTTQRRCRKISESHPKKKANQYIREQFEISPDPDREGYLKIVCIHCQMYKNWKTFNASVASDHIVQKCKNAPTEIRQLCDGQTQASKRAKTQLGLIVGGPLSQERVIASESSGASSSVSSLSTSLRDKARSKPGDKAGRKKHQQSSIQSLLKLPSHASSPCNVCWTRSSKTNSSHGLVRVL